ncbi:MAG: DUF2461 domain-containing protein [Clostridia bacterium]|nr:DUF2461 domain-containing protein [Clostridia bacterium]
MFTGFTRETLEFFMAIRFNNNREFFNENHDWYLRAVRKPLLDLAAELSEVVGQIDPELERRPERTVSRINRDIRFSRDKSPYRDWMWIGFHRRENKGGTPGYFVDISDDHLGWGMGFWEDNRPLMRAHRLMLEKAPQEFCEALKSSAGGLEVSVRAYKRMAVPEQLSDEIKSWYPLRSFYLYGERRDEAGMLDAKLAGFLQGEFKRMAPLYQYFAGLTPVEE